MRKILISLLLVLVLLPIVLSEDKIKIESKINSGYNDAYERNGNMHISGVTIDMGKQSTTLYRGGFRFANIPLPKGAIIEDAKLSLAYNWASASTSNLLLYGEASDNALQFKTTSKDISSRIKTKSGIIWNNLKKVSWGTYQTSPNISIIVQEIINRANWKEGNSIVILGYESSNSIWEAVSYEGTDWNYGLYGAKLQITASIPSVCVENWECTDWSICSNGQQTRTCEDLNSCGTINNKPIETQDCSMDLCENVACDDSTTVCQDSFTAACGNTCDSLTGLCNDCVPSCEGHDTPPPPPFTNNALDWCYQETADVSTGCGGLSSGTYNCDGNWLAGYPCSNSYDGDWDTEATPSDITIPGELFFNYTKPLNALNSSLLQIKDGGAVPIVRNLSLGECWNQNPLQFHIATKSMSTANWSCWNGTEWHVLLNADLYSIFEEAMWWDMELCKGITCEDSVLVCPDGFISTCTNYCNEENGLCSQCTPTCIGHEQISYQEAEYTYKVSSGYDDAYERSSNMYLNGATIDIGNGYYGGFRFNNIQIPKGSIIKDAKLSLAYNWASSSVSNIILYGENSDNAKQFQSTSKDITNRARTKGITWTNLAKGSWGAYQTSPNVSIIIQEITDRTNWKKGSSIAILGYYLSGGIWEAVSYEGTDWNPGVYSAKLEIKALIPTIPTTTPPIPPYSTGIILVQLDDTSPDQLDRANLAVEKFHNEGIAITPELWPAGLSTSNSLDIALLWDSWSEVEIAQGIYSGSSPSKSYSSMVTDLQLGKAEYATVGVTQPTSYLPHMGYPTSSGLDALRDEGFLVVIDYVSPDRVRSGNPSNPSEMPLTIYDGRDIAEGGLDDYDTILSSVRSQVAEKGYADLAFHVWAIDESMSEDVIQMMKRLRDEEGYTFMTATEYYHSVWG